MKIRSKINYGISSVIFSVGHLENVTHIHKINLKEGCRVDSAKTSFCSTKLQEPLNFFISVFFVEKFSPPDVVDIKLETQKVNINIVFK